MVKLLLAVVFVANLSLILCSITGPAPQTSYYEQSESSSSSSTSSSSSDSSSSSLESISTTSDSDATVVESDSSSSDSSSSSSQSQSSSNKRSTSYRSINDSNFSSSSDKSSGSNINDDGSIDNDVTDKNKKVNTDNSRSDKSSPTSTTCSKANEIYSECPPTCPPGYCGIDIRGIRCAAPPKIGSPECPPPACICKNGFFRDDKGECVRWEDCPKCNSTQEAYNPCPPRCPPLTCDGPKVVGCLVSPTLGDPACKPKCLCKPGLVRNSEGECIEREQCPKCTRPNEVYVACPTCDPNTCETIGKIFHCPLIKNCKGKCECKPGYYRNKIGECISKENCLKCSKPNEYFSCGGACDNVCATLSKQNQTSCEKKIKCNEMCYCLEGYARNDTGDCVPFKDCPKEPTCPDNEVWDTCPPQECDAEYCSKSKTDPQDCAPDYNCEKPRCTCRYNEKRDRITNKCIPITDCPPFPCPVNEVYDACPSGCPGDTCKAHFSKEIPLCSLIRIGIVVPCQPSCTCKKNYYRNIEGVCVTPDLCLRELPPPQSTSTAVSNTTSSSSKSSTIPEPDGDNDEGQKDLTKGINDFAFEFLKKEVDSNPGQNSIISPYSVQIVLAQLCLFAEGDSLKQLLAALGLSSKDEVRKQYKAFLKTAIGGDGLTFNTANGIYFDAQYPISDNFAATIKDVFNGSALNTNFSRPQQAADEINKWVEEKTNNRIKDLIPADAINDFTRMILVNALYFQGTWKTEFNKNKTQNRDFYVNKNTTRQVPTMSLETKINYFYSSDLDAQVVKLPYTNENYSFVIILPSKRFGLKDLLSKLTGKSVTNALNSMSLQKCILRLPSMEIDSSFELTKILNSLGIKNIFEAGKSGLSGILKKWEELFVSAVFHKAFVKVNEKGSEAAAATGGIISTRTPSAPPPPPIEIKADHPFAFGITYKNAFLFIGTLSK